MSPQKRLIRLNPESGDHPRNCLVGNAAGAKGSRETIPARILLHRTAHPGIAECMAESLCHGPADAQSRLLPHGDIRVPGADLRVRCALSFSLGSQGYKRTFFHSLHDLHQSFSRNLC